MSVRIAAESAPPIIEPRRYATTGPLTGRFRLSFPEVTTPALFAVQVDPDRDSPARIPRLAHAAPSRFQITPDSIDIHATIRSGCSGGLPSEWIR